MTKRIIPVLTIDSNYDLINTVKYKKRTYIGCPINAVKIFNDKMCDEICIINIDDSLIDYKKLSDIVSNCFMPVSYSGSINSIDQVKKIFDLGVEKIILNESSFNDSKFITSITDIYGVQSVCFKIDFKKNLFGKYKTLKTRKNINEVLKLLNTIEIGEVIISNVSDDGMYSGYDLDLFNHFKNLKVPVIIIGGGSSYENLHDMMNEGFDVGASSVFVYYGKHKAVLINYKNGYVKNEDM